MLSPSTAGGSPQWAGHACAVLVGSGGPDGVASRVRGGMFPVSARGGLGPWGVPQTSDEGAAEGAEDLVHKGCVRCSGFCLSAHGGQQLSA